MAVWLRDVLLAWLPALGVVAVLLAVLFGTRWLLARRADRPGGRTSVTGQLVLLIMTAAGVVAVLVALPLDASTRSELLGLLGLLLSAAIALSSTTFIGNAMAGLMLRAIRNIRPGDFVRVGDEFGRVSEQGILHTEIQTEDRDLTTVPNLHLVTHPVTVMRSGTVLSATVSLGYDVPHEDVEAVLVEAARGTELEDPFVQILELGDYSVTYRVAGFLKELKFLLTARSKLRAAMLDGLHGAGIEIVSPSFMNQRALPPDLPVIPGRKRVRPAAGAAPEEPPPEARIFDKAVQAEVSALEVERIAVGKQIDELEQDIQGAEAPRREELEAQLVALKGRRDEIEATLAASPPSQPPPAN